MLNHNQLRQYIIQPSLQAIKLYSPSVEELLVGTCAQESLGGTFLVQKGGPARGIYQCEQPTYDSIWNDYLFYHDELRLIILRFLSYVNKPTFETIIYNLYYATIICRLHYLRIPYNVPEKNDLEGQAKFWKQYYNTPNGGGTVEQYIANYHKFIGN